MTGNTSLLYEEQGGANIAGYEEPSGAIHQSVLLGGVKSDLGVNSTESLLSSGGTFTGTGELTYHPDVMVSCFSDVAGTLYFDFSVDGTNWRTFPTSGFAVAASTHEFHTAVKGPRYFRARFVMDSGTQSTFQLYTYYGTFREPNSPLSQTIGSDADAVLVRVGSDPDIEYATGKISGYSVVQKFGRNIAVSTSFVPIALGGLYQTPQVAGATKLRVKAGNANDTSDGTGARTIYIEGLDATGALVSENLTTNGASAGADSTNSYIRMFRAYVATSGTYATQSAGSHSAAIVIENAAGTADWATIGATKFPKGQSEIACYSVPLGYTAYVREIIITVDGTKTADIVFFQRRDILQTSAPYSGMRAVQSYIGLTGETTVPLKSPLGPFPALTDLGFMGTVTSTTAAISVNFEILLIAT